MAAQRQAPGGNSSICFGTVEDPASQQKNAPLGARQDAAACAPAGSRKQNNSSNAFAQGHNQNEGNALTDRSSTRVRQAPGGSSSIMFGNDGPEDRFPQAKAQPVQQQQLPLPEKRGSRASGGASRICLGEDSPTRKSTAMEQSGAFQAPGNTGAFAAGVGRNGQKGGAGSIQFGEEETKKTISTKKKPAEEDLDEEEFMQALGGLGRGGGNPKDQDHEQAKENKGPPTNQLPQPEALGAKKREPNHHPEPVAPRKLIAQYEQRSTTRAPPGGQSSVMFG